MNLLIHYVAEERAIASIIEAQLRRRMTVHRILDDIVPGSEWKQAIAEMIFSADAMLVLLSNDAYASNLFYDILTALKKTEKGRTLLGEKRIFLLIARGVDWRTDPLWRGFTLLNEGKPLNKGDKDQNIADAISALYNALYPQPQLPQPE